VLKLAPILATELLIGAKLGLVYKNGLTKLVSLEVLKVSVPLATTQAATCALVVKAKVSEFVANLPAYPNGIPAITLFLNTAVPF